MLEQLEARQLLASDLQNPDNHLDVNADQQVSPLDALLLINHLSDRADPAEGASAHRYFDTMGLPVGENFWRVRRDVGDIRSSHHPAILRNSSSKRTALTCVPRLTLWLRYSTRSARSDLTVPKCSTTPSMTLDPNNAPFVQGIEPAMATYADPNGNVTETLLDQQGQMVSSRDGGGRLATNTRNSENLVEDAADGRGFLTEFEYDTVGNPMVITDSMAVSPRDQPRSLRRLAGLSRPRQNLRQIARNKTYTPLSPPVRGEKSASARDL